MLATSAAVVFGAQLLCVALIGMLQPNEYKHITYETGQRAASTEQALAAARIRMGYHVAARPPRG